jgi:hypothetical protein
VEITPSFKDGASVTISAERSGRAGFYHAATTRRFTIYKGSGKVILLGLF